LTLSEICNNKHSVKFLKRASQFDVRFIVIGGAALCYHGLRPENSIKDLDIYIDPVYENVEQLLQVFQFFDINLVSDPSDMCRADMKIRIHNEFLNIDILSPRIDGTFDGMYNRAIEFDGLYPRIKMLAIEDMINIKKRTVEEVTARLRVHEEDLERLMELVPR